jgi:hypothetical protein
MTRAVELAQVASLGVSEAFKNRIINGAMVISQRNGTSSVTPINSQYVLDRFQYNHNQASKFTTQQSTTAPAGFVNSLLVTSSSAYSLGAGDYFAITQPIEGYNVADLGWGTANAKTVTLSAWVYSSLTGTFGGSIMNGAYNYAYPFTYSIPVANTWTQISVTIAGPTAGTWPTDNSSSVQVIFGLGVGTTYSGTAGAWTGSLLFSATGAVSVVSTNGATFYITGVQLEVGSTASSFEYRSYGTELSLCQRYYIKYNNSGATSSNQAYLIGAVTSSTVGGICSTNFANQMRTNPTGSYSGAIRIFDGSGAPTVTSISGQESSPTTGSLSLTGSGGGLTTGRVALIIPNGSSACFVDFSAEL